MSHQLRFMQAEEAPCHHASGHQGLGVGSHSSAGLRKEGTAVETDRLRRRAKVEVEIVATPRAPWNRKNPKKAVGVQRH